MQLRVEIVLDKRQANKHYSALEILHEAQIPIRYDYKHNIMHDKYIIIDGNTVETGSFNYTNNAEHHNAEIVIVINDDLVLAGKYSNNWHRLWNEAVEAHN